MVPTVEGIRIQVLTEAMEFGKTLEVFLTSQGCLIEVIPPHAVNDERRVAELLILCGTGDDARIRFLVGQLWQRQLGVPVLLVFQENSITDRLHWLEQGVDEVLAWPYAERELVLRIRCLARRQRILEQRLERVVKAGRLTLHLDTRCAFLDGRRIDLTDYEFRLLSVLAEHRGEALRRERMLELAKGSAEESFDRSIDVRISRLRSKLNDDPRHPRLLRTIRGIGYSLSTEDESRETESLLPRVGTAKNGSVGGHHA